MSVAKDDLIYLDVEDTVVTCKKNDLVNNSDYFKAMLDGNFVERNQSIIKIEGVLLKAINAILILLWDQTYVIDENDILEVLQAACMLQFDNVKEMCIKRVNEMLRLDTCLKIWIATEQLSLKPLSLKAKLMALQEFLQVSESDTILDLTLNQLMDYLGNIYLKTENELTVFQTGIKWWYENSERVPNTDNSILLKLLSCLDFKNLDENSLNEIMVYPDIRDNDKIIEVLRSLKKLKNNEDLSDVNDSSKEIAQLLYENKSRKVPCYPTMLVNGLPLKGVIGKTSSEQYVIYCDQFNRKRVLTNLLFPLKPEHFMVVYYDGSLKKFNKFFIIDPNKCENLEGFKLVGYKELVFMYGGQHLIGKGEWNVNFWVYDSVTERWERKSRLPHCRRHFESCIVGNKVFIAGGVGSFRIIQDNVFFYDYKLDTWSSARTIAPMKCCDFLNKCFFFSAVQKCGFFWEIDSHSSDFIKVDVIVEDDVLKRQSEYAIFSYKNSFFIKGKDLIEFIMDNNKLVVNSIIHMTNVDCDKVELTLCNEIVYTIYKFKDNEGINKYSLETFNLETQEINFIFRDLSENCPIGHNKDNVFLLNSKLKIFSVTHYNLMEDNFVINEPFINWTSK